MIYRDKRGISWWAATAIAIFIIILYLWLMKNI